MAKKESAKDLEKELYLEEDNDDEEYTCYQCGAVMQKADEHVLVCPNCGHSCEIEDWAIDEELVNEYMYGCYEEDDYGMLYSNQTGCLLVDDCYY